MDPEVVREATRGARSDLSFQPHATVFTQGDAADAVFYILDGRVQMNVVSDHGKEGVVALFGPGDFFGEGCLTSQPLRMASAVTTVQSKILRVEKQAMVRLLRERPEFSAKFMAFLLERNIHVEADIVDHLFNSSEKRLARILLLMATFNNDGKLQLIEPKISQEVLAARVGTTRSRINHFMNKFKKMGLIEYNGHIKVHTALINIIIHEGKSSRSVSS